MSTKNLGFIKKVLAMVICASMLFALIPFASFAIFSNDSQNIVYASESDYRTKHAEELKEPLYFTYSGTWAYISFGYKDGWDEWSSVTCPYGAYEYKIDDGDWQDFDGWVDFESGQKLYFRITEDFENSNPNFSCGTLGMQFYIDSDVKVEAHGNIMSLLYHDFENKTSLRGHSVAFYELFNKCSMLKTSPLLPATELSTWCYSDMFAYSGIEIAPELPAMELTDGCYNWMFYNCSSLTEAPKLPATKIAAHCYESMFNQCYKLATFPQDTLPATTVYERSYCGLFLGTSISVAPEIMATNNAEEAYEAMFGSTKIKSLRVHFSEWGCFDDWGDWNAWNSEWLDNVANTSECTFYCPVSLDLTQRGTSTVPSNWNVVRIGDTNYLHFIAVGDSASVSLVKKGSANPTILYSKDVNKELSQWDELGDSKINLSDGETVYLTTNTVQTQHISTSRTDYCMFSMTGAVEAGGSIMSLLSQTNNPNITLGNYEFYNLFKNCLSLKTAPSLPATNLAEYCYGFMFSSSGLTSLPEDMLPATKLADHCYMGMFSTLSITNAPELPAMELAPYCYNSMFAYCSNLTAAPELLATTLYEGCYFSMFFQCTDLVTGPSHLPATNVSDYAYYQMMEDTAITQAPVIMAESVGAGSFYRMFINCPNLNSVTISLPSWPDGDFEEYYPTGVVTDGTGWLTGVASTGTFTCPYTIDDSIRDAAHIPEGWRVVKIAPTEGWNEGQFDYSAEITPNDGGWSIKVVTPLGENATITNVTKGYWNDDVTDGISGDTLTVPKTEYGTVTGTNLPIYGDIYHISYQTNRSNSGTIHVNLRVVENVAASIDTTKLENVIAIAQVGPGTTNLVGNYSRTVDVNHVVTVGSIGSKDNPGTVMGIAPSIIETFNTDYQNARAMYISKDSQADVIAAADKLEKSLADLNAGFDVNFINFSHADYWEDYSDGKTVSFDEYGLSVNYAKGIYKSKPDDAIEVEDSQITLNENGVYTFFVEGEYFIFNMSQKYYVVVGQNDGVTTDDSLVQAVKDTILGQLKASAGEVFTAETSDLQELINMGFAYIDAHKPGDDPTPTPPPVVDPVVDPTFSDYVNLKINANGDFEWSAKNNATILGMSYATGVSDADRGTALYYPIAAGRNSIPALKSKTVHTFKAVLRVNGNVEIYYKNIESAEFNTPAVIVLSPALGVFNRGSSANKAAYIKGVVADLTEAEESYETLFYVPISDDGVMFDKGAFDSGEYTFFFFNANGEYVTQKVIL